VTGLASLLRLVFLLCLPALSNHPFAFAPGIASASAAGNASKSPIITLQEAEQLIDLLPVVKELRAKGMAVKWETQAARTMNDKDYYFFWIFNATAQKRGDIGSISVGDYAVNKYTADVRIWQVSDHVFEGDDGVLVTATDLEGRQKELRRQHNIDSKLIQEYRLAHLANRIIPRALEQSAVRLPVSQRSNDTAELSCWKGNNKPTSRLGRSPDVVSSTGYRAYAEVEATAFKPKYPETYAGPLCENRVKLFLAKGERSRFQIVLDSKLPKNDCTLIEGRDVCEANGIQLVDWSKDGRFLLVELTLWEYESDAVLIRVPIIYDASKSSFIRPDVYHSFDQYYKTDAFKEKPEESGTQCEFQIRAEGFSSDDNIILSASRPPESRFYDQTFCLDQKQIFMFNLQTNTVKLLPSNHRVLRFGARKGWGHP